MAGKKNIIHAIAEDRLQDFKFIGFHLTKLTEEKMVADVFYFTLSYKLDSLKKNDNVGC